eukprot:CCRYP_013699-RB/>CCRYP_013699-RB protein AED:0.34 eAED:0.34 QI:0/-1/0/1/-1/1/1/0/160
MMLSAHSDSTYLNASKSRSRAGAYIMCSENDPVASNNGPVHTIAQIIKFVTPSAAQSKLAALFSCTKEMVPLCQSLIKMGWPQPQSLIQADSTTAEVVAKNTVIAQKMKSMDMHLWWLCCCESQDEFCYYWGPVPSNLADYSTKPYPHIYHESQLLTHAG